MKVQIEASDLRAVQDVYVEHAYGREAHRLMNAMDAALASEPNGDLALEGPLTREQARALADKNGEITAVARVPLDFIVNADPDDFLNELGEQMIDSTLIQGVQYRIVGYDGNDILLRVTADISEFLAGEE